MRKCGTPVPVWYNPGFRGGTAGTRPTAVEVFSVMPESWAYSLRCKSSHVHEVYAQLMPMAGTYDTTHEALYTSVSPPSAAENAEHSTICAE